jgi:hypothetical protein
MKLTFEEELAQTIKELESEVRYYIEGNLTHKEVFSETVTELLNAIKMKKLLKL